MANFKKNGYGQLEPNHLSAQRTSQIYAQLPADASIDVLENGQFVKYDINAGKVNYSGEGEWMLVYNEVKLYDDRWRESYKDFALRKADAVGGEIVPRVFKTNVGDIYTTNCVKDGEISKGDKLVPGSTGILEPKSAPTATEMVWLVGAVTTMPDGEPAVKIQRIQ